MIDKYIYKFLDLLDKLSDYFDRIFFPTNKKKKK